MSGGEVKGHSDARRSEWKVQRRRKLNFKRDSCFNKHNYENSFHISLELMRDITFQHAPDGKLKTVPLAEVKGKYFPILRKFPPCQSESFEIKNFFPRYPLLMLSQRLSSSSLTIIAPGG